MEIIRKLNLAALLEKKSFFLFGPRSTGKTTLIRQQLQGKSKMINLLDRETYLRFSAHPGELEAVVKADPKGALVVIDEIQKIPMLLDEVHRLIESEKQRFLLTGSSARKLKRGQANLLAGRAWLAELFPLTWSEIPKFELNKYLLYGGLPHVYLSAEPAEELRAYAGTYLYEEIQAEGIVRKIPAFSRFLEAAAVSNGQLLNFTEVANDCQVSPSTVREYYSILEDTLMGFLLQPWLRSKKRKAIQTAKFYFFDMGVVHSLTQTKSLDRHSDLYGRAFEHFIGMELRAYLSYRRCDEKLTFWRSVNDQEVDYLVGDHTAIEVKSSQQVSPKHLRGLEALAEEGIFKNFFLVTQDKLALKKGKVTCLYWEDFLQKILGDELF